MALIQDLYKESYKAVEEAAAKNDLRAIAEQIPRIEALLNDAPNWLPLVFLYATAKMVTGSYGAAIPYLEWCSEQSKDTAEIWNNLGTSWKAINKDDIARVCWDKAAELRPCADCHNNLATLHINTGSTREGIKHALQGFAKEPGHARLQWNYALLLLELGAWRQGFKHYDWGLKSFDRPNRHVDIPMWEGQEGKVLVYGEQGMGDEIMWSSCIQELAKTNDVVFECHERMEPMFKRSLGVKTYPTRKSDLGMAGNDPVEWIAEEKPDYRLPLGSIFRHFRSDGNFPKTPYLEADMELASQYRKRMEALGPPPYVGIAWRAGGLSTRNDLRSLKLGWFNPILEKGGTFISLQYTSDAAGKVERFDDYDVHHWQDLIEATAPDGTRYTGFHYDHTFSIVQALDLCIVPNTTIAHLCGASGNKCWTLTPDGCAWRYQKDGEEMPMYGSWVRQIRQAGREWAEVLEDVGREYQAWMSA